MDRKILHALRIGVTFLMVWSCSNHHSKKNVQADPDIQNSFQDAKPGQFIGFNSQHFLGIKKASLDKEFLLQGSFMNQEPIPQMASLKSRIVSFRETGGALFLMEASQGHLVTDELPSQLILAKYPIISQNKDTIFFDFAAGMSDLFVSYDWAYTEDHSQFDAAKDAVAVKNTFIESIAVKNNSLVIRQIAQIQGESLDSVEIKYYLEPYLPSEDYEATSSYALDTLGFFEVAPQYDAETGELYALASRWDTNKPIVYAVSHNTPEEYQQAIKDAVLYWNRAFDKPVLKVVVGPKGVTAPDYNYNIIQWVNWNDAGYAYADAQMDPRTGEIRHAQIFMTSVFAVGGEADARRLLKEAAEKAPAAHQRQLSLKGMVSHPLCARGLEQKFYRMLKDMVQRGAADEEYLRISKDIVREVVAHEVGHTLGLRHNFAGSLGASYTLQERDLVVQDYVSQNKVNEDVYPSSSLMDYQATEEAALTGHIIGETTRMLDYDRKAMQTLYLGQEFSAEDIPAFCTDTQMDQLDCQEFDIGKNPIEALDYALSHENTLTQYLFEEIVQAKKYESSPYLKAQGWAEYIMGERRILSRLLAAETPLVQVRRNASGWDDLTQDEIFKQESQLLQDSFQAAGGWDRLLSIPSEDELKALPTAIDQMILDLGPDAEVSFTAEEKAKVKAQLELFVPKLRSAFAQQIAQFVARVPALDHSAWSESFVQWLDAHAHRVLLNPLGTEVVASRNVRGKTVALKLPLYQYQKADRLELALNLSAVQGNESWRLLKLRSALSRELEGTMTKIFGDLSSVSLDQCDDAGAAWLDENSAVDAALFP